MEKFISLQVLEDYILIHQQNKYKMTKEKKIPRLLLGQTNSSHKTES